MDLNCVDLHSLLYIFAGVRKARVSIFKYAPTLDIQNAVIV